jgi:hypothetical protein
MGFHALFVSEADLQKQVKDDTNGVLTDPDEQAAATEVISADVLV